MRVAAVVAARNEAGRVGATVEAIRSIPGVDEVVVADGSSEDGTADEALAAGARVLVGPARDGKGGALEAAVGWIEPADVYLLLDADLGLTAREGGALLDEVRSGAADLAIGLLPREPRHGGFRLVKRAAGGAIRRLSGFRAAEPLSGQRAITAACLAAGPPLAPGFGVEVAMTVDAARAGFGGVGVPVAMRHAPTGPGATGVVLAWAAAVLVFATGFLDDALGHHARGLRGHLASLLRGRPTTGVLKLVVGTALGIGLAVWLGGDETVPTPRIVEAVPPLRWFARLGRRS